MALRSKTLTKVSRRIRRAAIFKKRDLHLDFLDFLDFFEDFLGDKFFWIGVALIGEACGETEAGLEGFEAEARGGLLGAGSGVGVGDGIGVGGLLVIVLPVRMTSALPISWRRRE